MQPITIEDFTNLGDRDLAVELGGVPVPLQVAEVRPLTAHRFREAPFSVLLRGPETPVVPQGLHTFRHARRGEMGFFMVPVGRTPQGMEYEAIFN